MEGSEMTKDIKPKRLRSPNFPVLSLEKCLSLTQTLLDKYARHPTPLEIFMKALGYTTTKSSTGMQTLAALSAYGLINVEGTGINRKIKVSDLAFRILKIGRASCRERV